MPRVASLVPSGTEWMLEMGLDDRLVAVTSACPERARKERPWAVRSLFDGVRLSAAETDRLVRERTAAGGSLYLLDERVVRETRPDVLLTQSLCEVCAASHQQVAQAAEVLGYAPSVLGVSPTRLADVPDDARAIARAAGAPEEGERAAGRFLARIEAVRRAVADRPRPRVVMLEWTDPPMACGHWFPDLAEAAGAEEVLGVPGGKSAPVTWDAVAAARPDALLVMPCGMPLEDAVVEARRVAARFPGIPVHAFDASGHFSTSGPSLAAAVGLLAHALHPEAWPHGDASAWRRVA